MPVDRVDLVRQRVDLRHRDRELRVEGMGQLGPERLCREPEQAWLGVEAVGPAADLGHELPELVERQCLV